MRPRLRHRGIPALLAVLTSSCLTLSTPPRAPLPIAEHLPVRGIAAHRGAMQTHPENTLAAFREAIRLGAHQIELDIRATADGQLVVMHDASVDRTTDGRGRVDELQLAEIRRLDAGSWKHPRFAGEAVPSLKEALALMPRDIWLNLDMKEATWQAARATEELVAAGRLDQAFLAVGSEGARAAREVHPEVLICDMDRRLSRRAYANRAIHTGASFIQLHARRGLPEPGRVARIREAGTRVNYCCVDDPDELWELFDRGVDFPLVNELEGAMRAAAALGIPPRGE